MINEELIQNLEAQYRATTGEHAIKTTHFSIFLLQQQDIKLQAAISGLEANGPSNFITGQVLADVLKKLSL